MHFSGTDTYIATKDLQIAVNAAIHLQKPLLVKGEPGTGKTLLAHEIAQAMKKPIYTWHVKSTTVAQQGLYEYDAVSRLRDSRLGSDRVEDIANYIKRGKVWEAFEAEEQAVLLIDEIDKADIEFPNDLLLELDKMEFYCYELQRTISAKHRPVVIITSNNEKELPDAFLRRCVFHYIKFPDAATMQRIVKVHYEQLDQRMLDESMRIFYEIRDIQGMKKKPSTSELIDWIKVLILERISLKDLEQVNLRDGMPPYEGTLIKNEQDFELIENLRKWGR